MPNSTNDGDTVRTGHLQSNADAGPPKRSDKTSLSLVLALLITTAILSASFIILRASPLADYDEAIYAQVAREALASHSPLAFTWDGNIGLYRPPGWYEKPPLMIWLTETAFSILGRSEVTARIWVLVFSLATVGLSCFWVNGAYGSRAAALTATAFLIAFQFFQSSSVLQMDIPVGFFILLSLFAFARARSNPRYFYLFWVSVGLGVMTKSVIGLLPIPIVLLAAGCVRDSFFLRSRQFYLGIFLFLAATIPWHLVETLRFGKEFWGQYVFYHLLTRWSTGIEGHGQPFSFYWHILAQQRMLVALFIPSFVYALYAAAKRALDMALFAVGFVVIMMFFSSSRTKLPGYILPIYPLVAASIGVFLSSVFEALTPSIATAMTLVVILACALLGSRYVLYLHHAALADHAGRDDQALGRFLASHYPDVAIYDFSPAGTTPAVIYYANRVVYIDEGNPEPRTPFLMIASTPPPFGLREVVLQTSTETLFNSN
jgi:4-amino-4-deoxy-L-arabinose transferase-like glycosyltransferase